MSTTQAGTAPHHAAPQAAAGEVDVERGTRTTWITIQRPESRNALTRSTIAALCEALNAASADREVRCVVLSGAGGHFCSGADLKKNMLENPELLDEADVYLDEYQVLLRAVVACAKPTVAMMDGGAVGFGADLALACDLRVASTQAYLQEKFVKIGLMPDGGGTFWLPRYVGMARAMRMILLAEKLEAKEMESLGLLAAVAEPWHLRARTEDLVREIEAGPPLAFAEIKRAMVASFGSLDEALKREREGQLKLLRSEDLLEGIRAWEQKREPKFEGR